MKKKITFVLLAVAFVALLACGLPTNKDSSTNSSQDSTPKTEEVVDKPEEKEINENIQYIANSDSTFNNEKIIEMANNRFTLNTNFYPNSKVPIPTSCVNGMVEYSSEDGTYAYKFGTGSDAKDTDVYLSGVCAYVAVLHSLGLDYELNSDTSYIIDESGKQIAAFGVYNTTDEGYLIIITPY